MKTVCKINQCAGCKACVDVCKKEAISVEDTLNAMNAIIDEKRCIQCGACERVCPNNSIVQKRNRRFGIKDGIEIPEKHLLLVELLLD